MTRLAFTIKMNSSLLRDDNYEKKTCIMER